MSSKIDWDDVRERLRRTAETMERSASHDHAVMERIFQRRADALARRRAGLDESTLAGPELEVVVFRLREERYALDVALSTEVLPLNQWTPVPHASSEILGLVNVRGEPVVVVELAEVLGLPRVTESDGGGDVLLLARREGQVGLRVEVVEAVTTLSASEVDTGDTSTATAGHVYVKGLAPGGLIVLDERALLEHAVFEEAL